MKLRLQLVFLSIAIASIASISSAQPVIDGVFDRVEWKAATVYRLNVSLPGGGTTTGALYLWNDRENLYAAVVYQHPALHAVTSIVVGFDSPVVDGAIGYGDDFVVLSANACPAGKTFTDTFSGPTPLCPAALRCGFGDSAFGGTSDGDGAVVNDGSSSVHELWHPLASADTAHDIQVWSGMNLSFALMVRLFDSSGAMAETIYPGPSVSVLATYNVL